MLIFDPALNTSFVYVIVPIDEIGLHGVRAVADTSHAVFLRFVLDQLSKAESNGVMSTSFGLVVVNLWSNHDSLSGADRVDLREIGTLFILVFLFFRMEVAC